jgi:hypothetical protein
MSKVILETLMPAMMATPSWPRSAQRVKTNE